MKHLADNRHAQQTHDINSPNDMVMDTDDYIGVASEPEKVAIINPDNLEPSEVDQSQDLTLATDRAYYSYYLLGSLRFARIAHDMHPVTYFHTRASQTNCVMF